MTKRLLSLILCLSLTASLFRCSPASSGTVPDNSSQRNRETEAEDLMIDVSAKTEHDLDETGRDVPEGIRDFSARLLSAVWQQGDGESVVISPVSVLYAMAMTANGADGATLSQLEEALGGRIDDLNVFLSAYMKVLDSSEDVRFNMANGIWYNGHMGFVPEEDFLQTNADCYRARLRRCDFNDDAVAEINRFVRENTFGMIDNVLDSLDPETVMCLVNAIGFEGAWAREYREEDITDGWFTDINGSDIKTQFLGSTERVFLRDEDCTGFIKDYSGDGFAFVALLPDEDVDISDLVRDLDGTRLTALFEDPVYGNVIVKMPRFRIKDRFDLIEPLSALGITDAFDPMLADFSRMGNASNNIYVSDVLHDAFIQVDETGTRAAASTEVIVKVTAAEPSNDWFTVTLDHPFVYMIVDTHTYTPIFIGCVTEMA